MRKAIREIGSAVSGLRARYVSGSKAAYCPDNTPKLLAVVSQESGLEMLPEMCGNAGWELVFERSAMEAIVHQQNDPLPIIFYDQRMADIDWRAAVLALARLSPHPCIILISQRGDKNLVDELIRCGGFEILRTPLEQASVIRAINTGWSIWKNQRHWRNKARQ